MTHNQIDHESLKWNRDPVPKTDHLSAHWYIPALPFGEHFIRHIHRASNRLSI